jgi:hypothetical protein
MTRLPVAILLSRARGRISAPLARCISPGGVLGCICGHRHERLGNDGQQSAGPTDTVDEATNPTAR